MLELIAFVLLTIGAGYALRKSGLVQEGLAKDLNTVVFYLTLPALVFLALHRAELSWGVLAMPLVALAMVAVALGLGYAVSRLLRLPRPTAGALMLALAFGNTTFFGYPIIEGLYGAQHLTLAIFYDQLGTTLAVNTVGVALASRMGAGSADWRAFLARLLRFPPIWALVIGLLAHGLPLPGLVEHLLDRLGGLTVPLIMLSIGMSLQFRYWREDLGLVAVVTLGRLVVIPALVWLGVSLVGLPVAYQQAAVMEAAMPVMFFALTVTHLFGLPVRFMVNAIMVTTLLSFATLPIWHMLLSQPVPGATGT